MASERRGAPVHRVRRIGSGIAVAMLAVLMVVASPGSASAMPSDDPVQTQGTLDNNQLESVIEAYNEVAGLIATDKTKIASLNVQVKQLDRKIGLAQTRLEPAIRQAYEVGSVSTLRLVLDSSSTVTLVNQLSLVQGFADRQREEIVALTTARAKDRAARTTLEAALKKLIARESDLAAKKRTILTNIAEQQKLDQQLPPGELNPPTPTRPVACPYTPATGAAAIAVRVACSEIGKPYVWAAAGPSTFDCSGLMVYAWGKAGKKLRHFTGWQWDDGTPITASQLRPGDLVFFYPPTHHHVGMYVGGGWMVNAPHTGDVVRMAKINLLPIAGYRRP